MVQGLHGGCVFDSLPQHIQPLMLINPLALVIEQTRLVAVEGVIPNVSYLILANVFGLWSCELAFQFFQRARRGFADVL